MTSHTNAGMPTVCLYTVAGRAASGVLHETAYLDSWKVLTVLRIAKEDLHSFSMQIKEGSAQGVDVVRARASAVDWIL